MRILAARHFETIKNVNDIQGYSLEDDITLNGHVQCKNLIKAVKKFKLIRGITYFNTPQSEKSAIKLSKLSRIPIEAPLSLKPYNLGIATGISNAELKNVSFSSYESINLFRERVISAKEIDILNSENVFDLEKRLVNWWLNEGRIRLDNKIVIGSNSTLIMITNLLNGILPSSENFLCYHINNGEFRYWEKARVDLGQNSITFEKSWPDVTCCQLKTEKGYIQASIHHQNWGGKNIGCIICPGYFGNSRQGPYGLYSKMARYLSKNGIKTVTFDYLGSGESTHIERSFRSDVFSAVSVLSRLLSDSHSKIIIGHSLGSTIASEIAKNYCHYRAIALAPIHSLEALSEALLTKNEILVLNQNGTISRRNVRINKKYCYDAKESWQDNSRHLSLIITAGSDQYDLTKSPILNSNCGRIRTIERSDHNFSNYNSQRLLFKELLNHINSDRSVFIPAKKTKIDIFDMTLSSKTESII